MGCWEQTAWSGDWQRNSLVTRRVPGQEANDGPPPPLRTPPALSSFLPCARLFFLTQQSCTHGQAGGQAGGRLHWEAHPLLERGLAYNRVWEGEKKVTLFQLQSDWYQMMNPVASYIKPPYPQHLPRWRATRGQSARRTLSTVHLVGPRAIQRYHADLETRATERRRCNRAACSRLEKFPFVVRMKGRERMEGTGGREKRRKT